MRRSRRPMLATIWMCTQEWSLIPSRLTALMFETCHQAFSPSSALTRSRIVRSLRLRCAGTLIRICATASAGDRRASRSASAETGSSMRSRSSLSSCDTASDPTRSGRSPLRSERMRTMNPVHDATCSVAACAEILGAKWTAVLVHDLSEGPRRFTQLEHSCSGISPRTLSERLRALEHEEIVVRRSYAESPPRVEYELTEKGEALLPIIEEMRRFGHAWLGCGQAA